MSVRLLAGVAVALAMPFCAWPAPELDRGEARPAERPASSAAPRVPDGIIRKIEFAGLRRIPAATLRAHILSREGQPLDPAQVEGDVRALDRLDWFEFVAAEVHPMPILLAAAQTDPASLLPAGETDEMGLRLVFVVEERPFLAAVEFRGSHVLSRERISAVLGEKQIGLRVAAPASRAELWRAGRAIEAALADLGRPSARVRLRLDEVPTAAVRATFEISDGPAISVSRVSFAGNRAFSEGKLRGQMKRIAPGAHLAELRHKNIYTRERLAEDMGAARKLLPQPWLSRSALRPASCRSHRRPRAALVSLHSETVQGEPVAPPADRAAPAHFHSGRGRPPLPPERRRAAQRVGQ